jgi:hypothetical protein
MRHVVKSDEISHLWMHETQDDARSGNMFFDKKTIYSYGYHFPIARIIRNEAGEKAVLFTTDTYSKTTARHISDVRQALDGSPVFHVSKPDSQEPATLFNDYLRQVERAVEEVKPRMRAETKLRIFGKIQRIVNEGNRFAAFVGLASRLEMPESLETVVGNLEQARKAAAEQAAREQAARAAKQAREAAAYRRKHAKDLERWRETGDDRISTDDGRWNILRLGMWPGALLRYDAESNEIQTSMGARVPVSHAQRAYRFVAALKAAKREWKRNGHTFHIGHFGLDSVDKKGNIKAGCHYITWTEIASLARAMNWDGAPVPATAETITAMEHESHVQEGANA